MRLHREEYLTVATFGSGERPIFVELFGPLVGLEEEWRAQGANQDELDLVAFDWDWLPVVQCGGKCGRYGGLTPIVIEDSERYLIQRDELGRTTKLCKGYSTLPLPMDFPVTDMDSWRKIKHLYEFREERLDWEAMERAAKARDEGAIVVASIAGGFDTPRALMGVENACLCYYDQPELMHDILNTLAETAVRVLERVTEKVQVDQLSVHEDMAGKPAPLIGPSQVEEFIRPYYRRVWDLMASRGARVFDMDSDGHLLPVLDAFLDAGLTSIHPVEPAAGMDMVALRGKYGNRLAMRGGIDKFVLKRSREEIRAELEYKMQPLMRAGGTIFGLDHRIPNGTPLENYRYYVDTGREILGLPPRQTGWRGWARMAF